MILWTQAVPGAEAIGKYETLGIVGMLLFVIALFLFAIFKEPPWLVTRGRHNSEIEAEREKTRIAIRAKEEAEAKVEHFAYTFEEILDRTYGGSPQKGDRDV